MLGLILSISEFATKLVAGLSGTIFALLILVLAVCAKNRVPKNIDPDELKRKAQPETENADKKGKKSKSDKSKNKAESAQDKQSETKATSETKSDSAATEKKESDGNK